MRRSTKGPTQSQRRNFVFSDRAMERLARLVQKTDASSDTEVIKKALQTYEALVNRLEEGFIFYVRDPSGQMVPLDLLIDVERQPLPKPNLAVVEKEGSQYAPSADARKKEDGDKRVIKAISPEAEYAT